MTVKRCTVYGLASTKDNEIRYIGQTIRSTNSRLSDHLREARGRSKSALCEWIRSVWKSGQGIKLFVLHRGGEWNKSESEYFDLYTSLGADLVNTFPAGLTRPPPGRTEYDDETLWRLRSLHSRYEAECALKW